METFIAVFTQLGVDSSLVPQFITIIVVFIICQFLFLGKLQEVIETREEKTVKLEGSAEQIIVKVENMQAAYKAKLDEVSRESYKEMNEQKIKITQKYTDVYKETEREVNAYVDQSRAEFEKEIDSRKAEYLSEADSLSESLVNKIIQ